MSELVLHAAHLSEAHQLRFSYLFDVAAKKWRDGLPVDAKKWATELWVVDAHSAPEAISQRPDTACVLLIATDDQAHVLRDQWPHQIDAQLPPDYSVGRLTQTLEHISVQAHGKRLRETLKNRRQSHLVQSDDILVKTADAMFLKATDPATPTAPIAWPEPTVPAEESTSTATALEEVVTEAEAIAPSTTATVVDSETTPGTRYRIKRWTQLTGSMAGLTYRQLLAAMISADRSLDELVERSGLARSDVLRLLQVLRGKGVLVEAAPPTAIAASQEASALIVEGSSAPLALPSTSTPPTSKARGFLRQLSRWIGQTRDASSPHP